MARSLPESRVCLTSNRTRNLSSPTMGSLFNHRPPSSSTRRASLRRPQKATNSPEDFNLSRLKVELLCSICLRAGAPPLLSLTKESHSSLYPQAILITLNQQSNKKSLMKRTRKEAVKTRERLKLKKKSRSRLWLAKTRFSHAMLPR